jgi:hypothetical protein
MTDAPLGFSHAWLKAKQRGARAQFPADLALRIDRALSWLGRAERELDDPDARFLFLWIALDAARTEARDDPGLAERDRLRRYLGRVLARDTGGRVEELVWNRFAGEIGQLVGNRHLFGPFWSHVSGIPGHDDWEALLELSVRWAERARADGDAARLIEILFDRFHVLRVQILRGGTVWGSGVTRVPVKDATAILAALVPVFLDLMMDEPGEDWGRLAYPPTS